jgi:MFS family permease
MIGDSYRHAAPVAGSVQVRQARNAVCTVFIGAGFIFASWASRIPQVRSELRVTPGVLGLILLCMAVGSAVAIPLSGVVITRLGEARTVTAMSLVGAAGLATVAAGYRHGIPPVAAGLSLFGFGSGAWDVAMNVQAAAVERALGRAIMPKFHAGWSIGTVAGAGTGTAMVAVGVPVTAHLLAVALAVAVAVPAASRGFLRLTRAPAVPGKARARPRPLAAWTETRTLAIGLFLLCVTVIEGAGNDWLSLGVIDGYHTAAALGTVTLAIFLAAMTAGRWLGPGLIDARGRIRVLRISAATALAGLLLVAFGGFLPAVLTGAALMGLGTSLGFPVGLSAAADDPRYAAGRVAAASSIGYVAFLAGPPAIGFVADRVGVLNALSITGVLLAAAFFLCRATAPISRPACGAEIRSHRD